MVFEERKEEKLARSIRIMKASMETVRELLVAEAARELVEIAAQIAPDEEDFNEAVHVECENHGDHALIIVEDKVADLLKMHPDAVTAMRGSIEWDAEVRQDDVSRAAHAVINEAIEPAQSLWAQRLSAKASAGPR